MDHRRALRAAIRGLEKTSRATKTDRTLTVENDVKPLTLVCTPHGGEREIVLTGGTL